MATENLFYVPPRGELQRGVFQSVAVTTTVCHVVCVLVFSTLWAMCGANVRLTLSVDYTFGFYMSTPIIILTYFILRRNDITEMSFWLLHVSVLVGLSTGPLVNIFFTVDERCIMMIFAGFHLLFLMHLDLTCTGNFTITYNMGFFLVAYPFTSLLLLESVLGDDGLTFTQFFTHFYIPSVAASQVFIYFGNYFFSHMTWCWSYVHVHVYLISVLNLALNPNLITLGFLPFIGFAPAFGLLCFFFPNRQWLMAGSFLHSLFYFVSILNLFFNHDHIILYFFLMFTLQIIKMYTRDMIENASSYNGVARFYFNNAILFYIQFPGRSIYLIILLGKISCRHFHDYIAPYLFRIIDSL